MNYTIARTIDSPFDEAVERVTAALATEGFGVLTTIDVRETLRNKLDVDFRPYTILGACNPGMAHRALQIEPDIGAMLPCNVVVQDKGQGTTQVAAVDPVASMAAVENEALLGVAAEVRERLARVIQAL